MPCYVISGILLDAVGVLNLEDTGVDIEASEIVVCLGLRGRDPGHQSSVARLGPTGNCIWDEEFQLLVNIAARDFADATLHIEVLQLDQKRCRSQHRRRLLASGSLRLRWIQELQGHCHPRIGLPLNRRHRCLQIASPQLRFGMMVLGPGDRAPSPGVWADFVSESFEVPTKPAVGGSAKRGKLPQPPCDSKLSFTMVGLWDMQLSKQLEERSSADLQVDVDFRVEAQGDIDELVLLESRMTEGNSKWHLPIDCPGKKAGLQLLRTYTAEFSVSPAAAWLVLQVQARSPSSEGSEVLFQAEGRMPLTTCWPPLPKISPSQGPDERQVGADDLLGKVPLFPLESSRAATELAEQLRGLGVTATPGAIGIINCRYTTSRMASAEQELPCSPSRRLAPGEEELEDGLQEDVSSDPAASARMTAAMHAYDHGYGKWEAYDVEAALLEVDGIAPRKARKRKQGHPPASRTIRAKPSKDLEMQEDVVQDDFDCTRVGEVLEAVAAAGRFSQLHLYIHDAMLTHLPEGATPGIMTLEVLLGDAVVASCSSGNHVGRPGLLDLQFREKKELSLNLPRQSRLSLRLVQRHGAERFVLGSAIIDLQVREWLALANAQNLAAHQAKGEDVEVPYPCEVLQLVSAGSGLLAAGSLSCWILLSTTKDLPWRRPKELWPGSSWMFPGELRVILHEAQSDRRLESQEVVACLELEQEVERLHHCRLPAPQYSDPRPILDGTRASFEWRFVFSPLEIVAPVRQIHLVATIFDARTWKTLGRATCPLHSCLAGIAMEEKGAKARPVPAAFQSMQVQQPGKIHSWGSLRLTAKALSLKLAEEFPAPRGREPASVPYDADNPRPLMEQAFGAQRLRCSPPATKAVPAKRPRPWRRRRKVLALAVLLALGAAAALLRKELFPAADFTPTHCLPHAQEWKQRGRRGDA